MDTALQLFSAHGYVATTIQTIADEAGFAVQTVYAVFGNKRELLRQALEAAVVGNTKSGTLAEQPNVAAIAAEPDPRRRAAMDAAISAQIARRIVPIVKVIREAAAVDPEFAATAAEITKRRRADMRSAARLLAGSDGLRMPINEAVGTLYVLYSPDVFTALTGDLGWSTQRYERWLADMLHRTLLS